MILELCCESSIVYFSFLSPSIPSICPLSLCRQFPSQSISLTHPPFNVDYFSFFSTYFALNYCSHDTFKSIDYENAREPLWSLAGARPRKISGEQSILRTDSAKNLVGFEFPTLTIVTLYPHLSVTSQLFGSFIQL